MNKNFRVLVGIPTMGAMQPTLVATLLQWAREFKNDEVSFYFTFRVAPVDRARNQIVKFFLEDKSDFTHLLFIDSDTVPKPDALRRLLAHDLPMISGLTPILHHNPVTGRWDTFDNAFTHQDFDEDGKPTATHVAERHSGLKEIFRCGSSCVLIRRDVFEKLKKPYYEFLYNEDHTQHTRSEDIHFCDRVRASGFTIHVDTDVVCQHYKEAVI